ncbi:STAS domain-containing protein [Streptomyces sp. NPDC093801]|uniref:STAS domain-containing protein n=1 Tax=Streptomyces sp. NPDC093801 TaxID=3155203 RepID=UPI00344FC16A
MTTGKEHTDRPTSPASPDRYVLPVSGDMDLDHVDRLRASLRTGLCEAPQGADIVLDLRNSSFCDSAGLNALLTAREQARERGHHLRLAAPSHQMIRVLEITGTVGLFALEPAVAA